MSEKAAVIDPASVSEASTPTPGSFEDGRPVRHPDGTETFFDDDCWVVQTKKGARGMVGLHFETLPDWMRLHAKRLLAQKWLGKGLAPGTLRRSVSSLRRGSRILCPFQGPTVWQLTPDHAIHVRNSLSERWRRGKEALAAARQEKGKNLAPREVRAVLRAAGGLGHRAIRAIVRTLNELVAIAARRQGTPVDCKFVKPKEARPVRKNVGGADPLKVLTSDELAAVIVATQEEIDEYEKASERLTQALRGPELDRLRASKSPYYERIADHFGLEGRQRKSIRQIAREEGLDRGSLGRTMRRHLTEVVGEFTAEELWSVRRLLRSRGVETTREEREHAESRLDQLLGRCDFEPLLRTGELKYLQPFLMVYGLHDGWLYSQTEASELCDVHQRLLRQASDTLLQKLVGEDWVTVKELRSQLPRLHSRAIKACSVQFLAVTFRRVAAPLLSLSSEPQTRWVDHRDHRLFGVKIKSFKMWGDEGLDEWLEVPGFHGETAAAAISKAQELTEPLRPLASSDAQDCLFIIPSDHQGTRKAVALTPSVLHTYVYNSEEVRSDGLFTRREVPRGEELSLHFFRHTHVTTILTEAGNPVHAARAAGNSPTQAVKFYWAMGSPTARAQAMEFVNKGLATGMIFDAALRLKMEAEGDVDPSIPPGQLSLEEALQRIKESPQFLSDFLEGETEPTPELVKRYLDRGIVVNLTRYGGCLLALEDGPCPAPDLCPIGLDAEASLENPGCGCRWQVLIPHDDALRTNRSDYAAMKAQRDDLVAAGGYEFWVRRIDHRLAVWEAQHDRMKRGIDK